ncbi:hypothetical protein [Kitasatospora kifunensis]|uniref:Uncharacterized protein n=1 Tax=Kitasatospora kifunensis TaxID=58351 RepID=A0A7W7VVU8_KITKI|nr:hypothetical protein [Kitasatospora kifunensis]MBB4924777.1 hypothetical protein [Kitasatospora kifunensis]
MGNMPEWMRGHLPPASPAPRRVGPLRRFLDALGGYRTYLCPVPDCTVRVRVRGLDAGEHRHYQELAADHGRHQGRCIR